MVVVAVLAILMPIAIPVFLGQRTGAQDRQAQSSLRNVLSVARAAVAKNQDMLPGSDDVTFAALRNDERSARSAGSTRRGRSARSAVTG